MPLKRSLPQSRYGTVISQNSFTSNTLHYRNPWITTWWSFAFPGFGHFAINNYFWGFILMSFEFTVNSLAKVNTAILYTMLGEFSKARDAIDVSWVLFYITVYIFSAWDAYRRTVELNTIYELAYYEMTPFTTVSMSPLEINILNKRKPYVAMLWSLILPGIGHFYLHRMASCVFYLIWWITIAKFSGFLFSIFYLAMGDWHSALKIINPQWFLYLPSIYGFGIFNTYQLAVEINKVFKLNQSIYLKDEYSKLDLTPLLNH